MAKIKIKNYTLEDLQLVLEESVSVVAHIVKTYKDIIEAGGELTIAQEKAVCGYITCLYQTNKDYRATKREIEHELFDLSRDELQALTKEGINAGLSEKAPGLVQAEIQNILKGKN